MAQVIKKFQNGGTSPTKKYGTFTIDGTKYEVNDDFLNQLTSYGKTLDEDTAYQFSKITDALRSGADLSYDSNANKLNGPVSFDVNNAQQGRLEKRRSKAGRWLGNMWGGKETTARHAVNALKNFKYIAPSPEPEKYNKYDWSRTLNAEYKRNPDTGDYEIVNGHKVYINGANNLKLINRLKDLKTILNYKDTDEFIGYNGLTKQDYINFYNKLGDKGISDLINRIEQGTWTEEDAMALDDIGAFLDRKRSASESGTTDGSKSSNSTSTTNDKWKRLGLNPTLVSQYLTIDDNGKLRVTDEFNNTFGTRNSIFNDWWEQYLNNNGNWNPDYSWLKGYTRVGNNLYKTSDLNDPNSELYKFAHISGGFYDLNSKNNYKKANEILQYLWGRSDDYTTYNPNDEYNQWMSQQGSGFRYRPLTGLYNIPSNQQLIEYFDPNGERDEFGRPKEYKYAIFDSKGNLITDNIDINDYTEIDNGTQQPFTTLRLINDTESPYNGMYETNIILNNGNDVDNIKYYVDPKDPSRSIFYSDLASSRRGIEGNAVKLPAELAEAISQNPQFWNKLAASPTLYERFVRGLQEGMTQQVGEGFRNVFAPSTLTLDNWRSLGFDFPTSQKLYHIIENIWGDRNGKNKYERQAERLINPYSSTTNTENNIPSNQKGGVIGTTVASKTDNKKEKVDKYKDPKKPADAFSFNNLTSADKWQIASIAGDVISLAAAIPTGGNPVSAIGGVGSTLAQFGADIKRDGLDWKDAGNLLLGLGLDALSFLPGVGIAGKTAKVIKGLKKAANVLRPALIAAGATQGVTSLNNLLSGKGTLDDWRGLANGLMALKGGLNMRQQLKVTEYKGKPKIVSKSKEQLRNEAIDEYIKKNPDSTNYEGKSTEWFDADTKKIKDYDLAYKGLKEQANFNKLFESKIALQAGAEKIKTGASNFFGSSYNPFSKNYRFRMSNRQLRTDIPLNKLNTRTLSILGYENPHIRENLNKQGFIIPNDPSKWIFKVPNIQRMVYRPKRLLMLPSSTQQSAWSIPGAISPRPGIKTEIQAVDPYLQSVDGYYGFTFHKKGGKIKKGQNGLIISSTPKVSTYVNHVPPLVDNIKLPNVEQVSETLSNISKSNSSNTNKFYRKEKQPGILDNIKNTPTLAFQRSYKSGILNNMTSTPQLKSSIKNQSQIIEDLNNTYNKHNANSNEDGFVGQEPNKNKFFINPDMILGIADFITSARAINKTADIEKDAIRKATQLSQQQKPTEFYSRFSDNGLLRSYDDRLKTIRQYKTVNSDPNQVMAERLMRDQQADELINDRNTKFSQLIGEYNDKLLGQKQTYANIRNQIVNENRTRLGQGLMQEAMVDSRKVTQNAQNLKNLIYQFRDSYARDLNERRATEEFINQTNSQTEFTNNLKQLFMNRGGWNAMSEEEKERYGNDWMSYTFDKYTPEAMNLRNQSMFKYRIDMYNDPRYAHEWFGNLAGKLDKDPISQISIPKNRPSRELDRTSFHKTGGKINNRIRPTHEQHYLDQQKAINSAIKDLNNNIVRLFLKMMS